MNPKTGIAALEMLRARLRERRFIEQCQEQPDWEQIALINQKIWALDEQIEAQRERLGNA